jgi:HK97 gp10 family phage protein
MARGVTIRFKGEEGLEQKFRAMVNEAKTRTLEAAVPPAGEIVIDRMKQLAPVEEGMLRDSLEMKVHERTPTRFTVTMEAPAPHWHLLEFGHDQVRGGKKGEGGHVVGHTAARPYIRPAFDATKTAMKNEIRDGIRDSILGFTE